MQPILNEDQLRLLMGEQHESEILDYKRELDLAGPQGRRAIVELAKDVGAMASGRGGYLCIGPTNAAARRAWCHPDRPASSMKHDCGRSWSGTFLTG